MDQTSQPLERTRTAVLPTFLGKDDSTCTLTLWLARVGACLLYRNDVKGHSDVVPQYGSRAISSVDEC